jgi:HEPN domain-containing protein
MLWSEQAQLLLRKARQDVVVVARGVEDAEIADEVIGFHVQQAGEKCMKAVLCARGVSYRRTHDLQELHDLLDDAGLALPDAVRELVSWSPFAVAYRYDDWQATDSVDRVRAHDLVRVAITWAEAELTPP